MNEVFTPRMTHLRLIEAEARIAELERKIAEMVVVAEPLVRKASSSERRREYMRDLMRKKRAETNAV
jgi:hypothetical protein